MIARETLTETCNCGARLTWTGPTRQARRRLAEWRTQHQHQPPKGDTK